MTYQETMDEALDRAHDAAESIGETLKEAAQNFNDKAHVAAESIEEPVKEAAKNINEIAKRQWGKITGNDSAQILHEKNAKLIFGIIVGVSITLSLYVIMSILERIWSMKKSS